MEETKKDLTCTRDIGYTGIHTEKDMQPTEREQLKSLLKKRLQEIDAQREAVEETLAALSGEDFDLAKAAEGYQRNRPFSESTLGEACLKVLRDHPNEWLTKAQVEYFVISGGHASLAKNPGNSVKITLHRLAATGRCQVRRKQQGNLYRALEAKGIVDAVENPRTTER